MRRLSRIWVLAVLGLAVGSVPASASVTVGQVAPGMPTSCASSFEFLDTTYVMPETGTITSWTHHAQANVGQTPTLKVYRKVSDPATYEVVGHDGPKPIDSGATTTFQTGIPVKAGDVLGITGAGGANIGCEFIGAGSVFFRNGNLADGGTGEFALLATDRRANVSVALDPANGFTLGTAKRNKKRGTATITVTLPNPGELAASAGGAKISSAKSVQAGDVTLTIKAKGKRKKTLEKTGKVKLRATLTYTPTGGDPSSQPVTVTLKKKIKK